MTTTVEQQDVLLALELASSEQESAERNFALVQQRLAQAASADELVALFDELATARESREQAHQKVAAAREAIALAFSDAMAAIEAVRAGEAAKAELEAALAASMSGEQRQLQASIDAATKALAVLIEAAKDKVREAGVSPSSAFVLSRRAEVSAEHPERLPAQHITIKASAAKLIGTPEAESAGLTVSEKLTVSYYPTRL